MPKWINKILGINQIEQQATKQFEMLTGGFRALGGFNGDAWSNDIYRSAVDTIARHIAKLSGKHVANGINEENHSKINRILRNRPNPYMSGYDFLYKIATHYYLYNNAFILVQKDNKGNLSGLYPLSASSVEYVVDGANEMYLKFLFNSGEVVHFHMSEIAVLRRHFNSNELLGDDNNAIMNTLDLAYTQQEGLSNSIKNSANIRGLLKYSQVLAPNKLKEAKKEFMNNYMTMENNGGIIPLDSNIDYVPLKLYETDIETSQIQAIKQKIYDYLGINENIITGNYSEDQWQSFFESIIEPFAIQLSSELTEKIFTEREQAFSNRIIFESSRLQYASTKSKATVIKELLPLGVLTINQALDLLNLPRVEDGDERIQSLNYIEKQLAKQYQVGEKEATPDERD
ncbi:phage portal protein [Staphylococcus coagulans]|uniref:phage portal protein n=1 Tax=Staphylococcus coagulans TaxID=74706 RepID=UPI0029292607|nr:phage portal protein [Staphylococcus coagulans]MDU9268100.1 phage portal protein [Staphylococcus coagulans]MDU9280174.1 phage portal protein [Staphylococcus coagulans]MDU9292217.1 phage portal protein [Staphylococcus coagulans]MDU9304599.1 phage portal protein [Staphylococcus coagulans]MDU9321598.1 phage portal protein [Staphylococcus coagulans]